MKILFVDDEPRILRGIERMLFELSDEWEIVTAESGKEALTLLEVGDFDVIVTDMHMPSMDGAEVLKVVSEKYPDVVRIVLSGYAQEEAVMRALPFAHQFLSKPSKAGVIQETVERACALQALLGDDRLRGLVGQVDALPPVPRVYSQLTAVLADLNSGADEVAKVIKQDSAMCAKLLQLVNSAFFSRARVISSVEESVVRLGFEMVKNLSLSLAVFEAPELSTGGDTLNIDGLQRHALETAAIARELLTDPALADDVFMAALLHDIGQLVMAAQLPEELAEATRTARREGIPVHVAELRLLGTTHAEIGAYLLGLWGLPYPIVEAVAHHHHPERVGSELGFGVLEAVYVANCLAHGEELDEAFLSACGVAGDVERWRRVVEEMNAA